MDEKRIYESCDCSRQRVEASGPRLNGSVRQKVNYAIRTTLKNQYWDKPYHALNAIEGDLERHGLSLEGSRTADIFIGDNSMRRFAIFKDGEEIANTVLVLAWGKAGDKGRFDVNAYLS